MSYFLTAVNLLKVENSVILLTDLQLKAIDVMEPIEIYGLH